MPNGFSRSLRVLKTDGLGGSILALFFASALLAAWFGWFMLARVSRYEISDQARLEVDQASYIVQPAVSGRVLTSRLALGRPVEAGEILVELDATSLKLQCEGELRRLSGISTQMLALRGEQGAEQQTQQAEKQAADAAKEQVHAEFRGADATARFAEEDSQRLAALNAEGLIALRDFVRGKAEAEGRRATADSLTLALKHLEKDQRTRESEREINIHRIQVQLSQLEAQRTVTQAEIERLRYEIERRRIRAPVSGKLGEIAVIGPGSVVSDGEKLGAVIPPGSMKVVAEFLPQAALGRILPGQHGRLRLAGFPWAQYGTLQGTVAQVGGEVRDGRIRVDFMLTGNSATSITIQHGLPGTLEVEVERVSPATLVLRSAGQLIAGGRGSLRKQAQ